MTKVREYRKMRQLSQLALAEQVGVARQTISLIESGRYNPSLALCVALAKALGTDLNTLFWKVEEKNDTP